MKKTDPLISVVIPAFNEEKLLSRCLSSLKKQTFTRFELIVVDNNSEDKTAEIAKNFGARVVRETIQGMTQARDRGFKEAMCEIIARTDADAEVDKNWLQTIYNTFSQRKDIAGITGYLFSPYPFLPHALFKSWSIVLSVILGKLFAGHIHLIGPNMAIRKSAWEKIKPHPDDKMVHEDIDLSCHLSEVGRLAFIPQMQTALSGRKVENNPLKGTLNYLVEYPIRYFKTVLLHHPFFMRHKTY